MKKQLFVLSFMIAMISNVIAFDERSMFDETNETSKWTFVENKFITKIAGEKSTLWAHAGAITTGVLAAGAGIRLFTLSDVEKSKKLTDYMFSTGNVYAGAGIVATGTWMIQALECYISAHVHRNAVEAFFTNWDQNQYFVPTELQEAFELIAETMELEGKEAVLKNADEIVEIVQFHVMRRFDGRYKNMLDIKAYDGLNTDAKTISGIIKNIVATSKDLGGSSK